MRRLATNGELTNRDFALLLSGLASHMPISDEYDRVSGQATGRWWSSQQEHMVSWFRSQETTGSGAFTRRSPNMSARTTYNRLQCPGALLWIAEALGVDESIVKAVADMSAAEEEKRRRSALIRRHIPWAMIEGAAERRIAETGRKSRRPKLIG